MHHGLIRAIVSGNTVQGKGNGVGSNFVVGIGNDGRLHGLADDIHAEAVGMQLAVTDVVRIRQGGIQVHHGHAEAAAHGFDGGIEAFHQGSVGGALTDTFEVIEHVHFRVGIPLGDLIQHDGGSLHGGGGGTVAVSSDQSCIIDIGIAQGSLAVAEIVEAHLDADDVRLLSGIVAGVVVELYTAIHIGAHSAGALQQNGAAAPGVVHQQPQVQILRHLHPPGIVQPHLRDGGVGIILDVAADGRIGRIRRRAVGGAGIGRYAGTKDGNGFAGKRGGLFAADGAHAIFIGVTILTGVHHILTQESCPAVAGVIEDLKLPTGSVFRNVLDCKGVAAQLSEGKFDSLRGISIGGTVEIVYGTCAVIQNLHNPITQKLAVAESAQGCSGTGNGNITISDDLDAHVRFIFFGVEIVITNTAE